MIRQRASNQQVRFHGAERAYSLSPNSEPLRSDPFPVLVVHNAYQQRGGEDSVVDAEVELLRRHGHAVELYRRSNDEVEGVPRAVLALQTIWSSRTTRDVGALLKTFKPAIVHVHNSLPLVSPSVYWAASRAHVPVVQTLHNFRLLCPQALMLREKQVCEDCVGKVPWRAVKYGCYRDSRTQSAVVATMLQVHRSLGTWGRKVTRYIALNEFCRQKFIEGGLPADRLRVKPNFVDLPVPRESARSGFLYVGRLSVEKGISTLANAMKLAPESCALRVAGVGSESYLFENMAGVQLLGSQTPAQVIAAMQHAAALVLPSIWYENFPRTVVEAFACGLPVIASRIGALASLIEHESTGLLFDPGVASDLAAKLTWALENPSAMVTMGSRARARYEQQFTGDSNYRQLLEIYADAMACSETAMKGGPLQP